MPLSDLFKRSPKKGTASEPQKGPAGNDSILSPEMQKKRYDAAVDFLEAFQERMPLVNGNPHAGTVLSVAARLAGTSLYRSFNYKHDAKPGTVILSEDANQAYPQLLNLFAFYCKQNGVDVMAKPLVTDFPAKDKPLMDLAQVQTEYQDQYNAIMKKHGLDHLESARAGMVVCSIIFEYQTKKAGDIDPYVATGIVAMGVIEGAKTAPLPLGGTPGTGTKKLTRLVLGEPDAVREEALATGAIYIEPHPEVLKVLQQGNIDPYVIYEEGVRKQIEERISRIDFVKVDVEKSYEEWKSKPQSQAPIHVRLIIWLKNNAGGHGYEQRGNSWVLKD